MAYDEELADRMREALAGTAVTEKAMFGGLAFLVDGHLAVAASGHGGLMARVDPTDAEALISQPGVERLIMRGREMAGWLRVDESAVDDDAALHAWVRRGVDFVRTLPPK